MKQLKDYLHLYLGCECEFETDTFMLGGVFNNRVVYADDADDSGEGVYDIDDIKPILRPLSDMTEEEMKELYLIVFNRKFLGDNITHRDIGKKNERWVLWSGVERLFIYSDGDVGADSDLSHYRVHMPTVILWFLSKHFDLFGLIDAGLAIDATEIKKTVQ